MKCHGGGCTNRILDAKAHRKRAEVDLQLLSNRIALLRQEDQKATTKVNVTKERASQIVEIKKRVESSGTQRAAVQMSREYNIKRARERATKEREDRKQRLERSKELLYMSKVAMANEKKIHSERLAEISKKDKVKLEIEKRQRAEESRRRSEVIKQQREKELKIKDAKKQMEYEQNFSKRQEEHKRQRPLFKNLKQKKNIYLTN